MSARPRTTKPSASSPTSARPGRRRDGERTRQRVLEAAVESILDVGYYHSSSNEIARRAGVTWGVIQHQFGTREALLLEVLDASWHQLQGLVADADIRGETLEDRLFEVLELLDAHYGRPEHLAALQIGLDLTSNPTTSAETKRAVRRHARRLGRFWQALSEQALGDAAVDDDLVRYTNDALRGYLIGNVISESVATTRRAGEHRRRLLVQGVAASIRIECERLGRPIP